MKIRRLVTAVCKTCDTEFTYCTLTPARNRVYCGSRCFKKSMKRMNREWYDRERRKRPHRVKYDFTYITTCKTCGVTFMYCDTKSGIKRRMYCGSACGSQVGVMKPRAKYRSRVKRSNIIHVDFDGKMTPEKRAEIKAVVSEVQRNRYRYNERLMRYL